ncbi:MAG: hypothetical protein Q4C20_04865, partial [Erysipelotrichaceae bacterium]|nr:hypothetical protein [Erysipelotrichaceae bacterium]
MRNLFMSICPYAIWCIVILEAVIAYLLFRQWQKKKQMIALLSFLVTIGLIIDALIIGLGSALNGDLLAAISPVRFIAHGLLIPLLFPVCGYALNLKESVMRIVWIVTGLLMAAGAAEGACTVLELKEMAGVVRYVSGEATPGWANLISMILSFGTVIPMMIIGVIVWLRQKTPYLFLSGFIMFVFSALGPATGNADLIFFISMFG